MGGGSFDVFWSFRLGGWMLGDLPSWLFFFMHKGGVLRKSGQGQKKCLLSSSGGHELQAHFDSANIREINAAQGGQLCIRRYFSFWENGGRHENISSLCIPTFAGP
jgi:hypothetical protein